MFTLILRFSRLTVYRRGFPSRRAYRRIVVALHRDELRSSIALGER